MANLIKVDRSATHGIGVFATSFILAGTRILREEPLLDIETDELFSPETVLETYNSLSPQAKQEYDKLHYFSVHDWPKLAELPKDVRHKFSIFRANSIDWMVFKTGSRFNHSCFPNACISVLDPNVLVVRTSRDIDTGEEVTINNLDTLLKPRQERQEILKDKWCFDCGCEACSSNTKEAEITDIAKRWQQLDNMGAEPHRDDPGYGLWILNRRKRVTELKKLLEEGGFVGEELRYWQVGLR